MNPSSFVEMLERADLVMVSGNTAGYQISKPIGKPENEIARFNWRAGRNLEMTTKFTERGVEELKDLECGYLCEDYEGVRLLIEIYQRVKPIE
ncbi:MAG: hypothetical protein RBR56_00535 [Halothiobacillus sp.]|nr:hypothetical protein [Halothiobacillus sp.]